MTGRTVQAFDEIRQARILDPVSLIIKTNEGWLLYFTRRYGEAIDRFKTVLEMDADFVSAHVKLGWTFEGTGQYADAIVEFQKALSLLKGDPAISALLGHAYALAGEKEKALGILSELIGKDGTIYVSPYWIACIYAGLEERDEAFAWLQKAYESRCGWLAWLNIDPKMDPLRGDMRFAALLRQVGLAQSAAR